MGNVPIEDRSSETYIRWTPTEKVVETDNGSRCDVYFGGDGQHDGPGHDHLWATFNQAGDMTNSGGRID